MENYKLKHKNNDITFCMANCCDTSCMRHLVNADITGYTSIADFEKFCTEFKQNNRATGI